MDIKGEYLIPMPREAVWAALNDVAVLKQAIPGCETLTRRSDTEIDAVVTAKVGPVKASFKGQVTLSDLDPPNGYTIRGEGKGGVAGFAKGGAKVRLVDAPGGTLLLYDVEASVGGKLAQIGQRLIDSAAKKLADDFFAAFTKAASGAAAATPAPAAPAAPVVEAPSNLPAEAPAAPAESQTPGEPAAAKSGKKWWLFAGLIVAAGLTLAFSSGSRS